MPATELSCQELVALITEYLEGGLAADERERFEQHVSACAGCQAYFEQFRQTIRSLGQLREEDIPDEAKEKLLAAFRKFRQSEQRAPGLVPLGIGGQQVALGDHIAYFWESPHDFQVGVDFLLVGLRGDDCCFVFGHDPANQRVLTILRDRGLDVAKLIEQKRLYVVGGDPSGQQMLAGVGSLFQKALDGGASTIRLLGNLGWGRTNWPSDEGILEFEARVTEAARQFPCVIFCMYDVRALPGRIILNGGFETHPLTVHHQVLCQNPHYVPLEPFLARLRAGAGPGMVQ